MPQSPSRPLNPDVEGVPDGAEQRGIARTVTDCCNLMPTDVELRHQLFKPQPFVLEPTPSDRPVGIEPYGCPIRDTETLREPLDDEIPTDRHDRSRHVPLLQEL